jgi:hypothetical protein
MSTLAFALRYASRGWPLFPLRYRSKEPRTTHGFHDATTDCGIIRHWFSTWPDANLTIRTGAGLCALDIDPRNGGDDTLSDLEQIHGQLPTTARALTGGGGVHYLFEIGDGLKLPSVLGEGIDIKSEGGYIVAAPSVHPSGKPYTWDLGALPSETPIAPLPSWIVARASAPQARRPPSGPVTECYLAAAFIAAGWAGETTVAGALCVRCPWAETHSDRRGLGRDSSTVVLPPIGEHPIGAFACAHSHCCGRSIVDVLDALPASARALAAKRVPSSLGALSWIAARRHRGQAA